MIHELAGCPFQPLSAYLKALAILRLISQEDKNARGSWAGRYFLLHSELDREGLIDYFLKRYRPTPVLAPWNGGSGFYAKDRKIGIDAIRAANDGRFQQYRQDLESATRIVAAVPATGDGASTSRDPAPPNQRGTSADLGADRESVVLRSSSEDARRTEVLRLCRNQLSDSCVEWLDAAIAISAEESRAFAPILGTGGNEGRLDYTNNFMENIAGLLIAPDKKTPVRALLEHALFDTPTAGLQNLSVGQYDPGRAGGFNQGSGISSDGVVNPWNAVLTLEGAIAWAGGIYRKQGVAYRSFLCSPFTVRPSAVGYGSAAEKDEGTARAEVWTPLWNNPARYCEISSLLREGRASLAGKAAQSGLEFAQAAASLGVDREISAFVRYSLLKRRGDSYIALPAGRFPVHYRSTSDRVRELSPFVQSADYAARGSQAETPNSWPPLLRAVKDAEFNALLHGSPQTLVDLAIAFGAMHRWLLLRQKEPRWPARLSADWVKECSVTTEGRIAAALAGLWSREAEGLLQNITPASTRFSWVGRDLSARMLSTIRRRTLDGQSGEESSFSSSSSVSSHDVVAFLEHKTDDEQIENLTFAFLLAKQDRVSAPRRNASDDYRRWPAYCLMKQLFARETHQGIQSPNGVVRLKPDLSLHTLLSAGRVQEAMETALRRLRVSGLKPALRSGWNSEEGARLGAALLIPVSDTARLRSLVIDTSR